MDIIKSLLVLRLDCNAMPNASVGRDVFFEAFSSPIVVAVPLRAVHSNELSSFEGSAFSAAAPIEASQAFCGVPLPMGIAMASVSMSPEMLPEACLECAAASGLPCIAAMATAFSPSLIDLSDAASLAELLAASLKLLESAPPLLGLDPVLRDGSPAYFLRGSDFASGAFAAELLALDQQALAQSPHAAKPAPRL